ncbi:hypothetical protein niasHT_018356 [Heterodera trifolii]|uniref:Peptidase A2 domain-containing protein n=1 Tax=Heterodera trifolii TaxID=157864 RepID=A0ABD2LE78_9BILA
MQFAKPQSIFVDRFSCLMATKEDGEEFQQLVNRHKPLLKDFQFDKMKKEQFKGLILIKDGERSEAKPKKGNTKATNQAMPTKRNSVSMLEMWENEPHPQGMPAQIGVFKCRYTGHLENQCESARMAQQKFKFKKVGTLCIGMAPKSINSASLSSKIKVLLNRKLVKFILDSGAEINVIDEETYRLIGQPKIWECAERGRMFYGTGKSFIGKREGHFEFLGVKVKENFYVAEKGSMNLLSVQTMDAFGLLDGIKAKINAPINLSAQVKNPEAKQMPRSNTTKLSASQKARPVPYNAKDAVDGELNRREKMGVIGRVEHTDRHH